jgi:hypothetical protein
MKQATVASKTTKDDIVAVFKKSYVECDKAGEGATDANAATMIGMGGRGQTSCSASSPASS